MENRWVVTQTLATCINSHTGCMPRDAHRDGVHAAAQLLMEVPAHCSPLSPHGPRCSQRKLPNVQLSSPQVSSSNGFPLLNVNSCFTELLRNSRILDSLFLDHSIYIFCELLSFTLQNPTQNHYPHPQKTSLIP